MAIAHVAAIPPTALSLAGLSLDAAASQAFSDLSEAGRPGVPEQATVLGLKAAHDIEQQLPTLWFQTLNMATIS